ncbi:unnamed protein product [Staurois parvus]|uniref:Uncharacterized protein n=1 Tax=Staurois parvus TaxID=386267 RepID=A0ABN9ABL1_9NEOB|nr:unnamed protein product [Staurois parvus]
MSPETVAPINHFPVWPMYINGLPAPCLCALPGSAHHRNPVPAVSFGHSGTLIVGRDLCTRSRSCDH